MPDGKFYLGKEYSVERKDLTDKPYLYESEDLTTHAVVFGMTGSGKTGLCLDLLEEAVLEDIPIIAVDPKGDVTNLALLFPGLAAQDFQPWVSPVEAKRRGKSLEEYARDEADKWKNGLAQWGVTGETMEQVRSGSDLRIFTPGSSAGMPISILEGFAKPEKDFEADVEGMVEKIKNTVSALLSLLDIDNDPLTSKPHIFISSIIEHHWRLGRSLSIEDLILNIQKPPMKTLGVFDIDRLIDEKERVDLSFRINNIIASPSFRFWTMGMPLSAAKLYEPRQGRTPVNIFSIAHLPENERMFFTSLLLNEIVYWVRTQPGAPDLKYLFYMDEIYGYIPPYPKNPPSKNPLMLLMKQARAFGLGVVLGTQNPKDIDYKALTNTGTWFIGKLQAEGDRERVLEGMQGLSDASGDEIELSRCRDIITSLDKRVFLVKNVHAKGLQTFQTRWAMSYLAGPLTREQIKTLTPESALEAADQARPAEEAARERSRQDLLPTAPKAEIAIEYLFETAPQAEGRRYVPFLHLESEVVFDDSKLGIHSRKNYFATLPLAARLDWERISLSDQAGQFSSQPDPAAAGYEPLGFRINYTQSRQILSDFKDYLFANQSLKLMINRELNFASELGETEQAFRQRCRDVVEKMIDKEAEKAKESFGRKIQRIEDRMEKEKLGLERLEGELKSRKTEEFISAGESILGVLLGSRSRRVLTTAARKRRMTSSASSRIKLGQTKLTQLQEELDSLKQELEDKTADLEDQFYDKADRIEDLEIRLEKEDILITRQAVLWRLLS